MAARQLRVIQGLTRRHFGGEEAVPAEFRGFLDAVDEARQARRGYWGSCPAAELNTGLGSVTGRR